MSFNNQQERGNTKLSAMSGFNHCQRKQCHLKLSSREVKQELTWLWDLSQRKIPPTQ